MAEGPAGGGVPVRVARGTDESRPLQRRVTHALPSAVEAEQHETLRRRVVSLMLFRLLLISLVLGSTLLLWWISDVDLATPSSMMLYAIIGATYLLTIIYALVVVRTDKLVALANVQLVLDLVISALLVFVTGGAQSAYAFFFPLSIIAAAVIHFRRGAVLMAGAAVLLFSAVAVLGWYGVLPRPAGQTVDPTALTALELSRSLALNLAACAGVAGFASMLGGQVQQTRASLASQRDVTADLYTLHEDIVRCLSSGLVTVDRDGRVLTINQEACDILGIDAGETVGRPLLEIMPGIDELLAEVGNQYILRRRDLELLRPGAEEKYLGLSVSPLRNNLDEIIGGIVNFQDLTEVRDMERQMRRAERLAVVGTLAAGVAHEIRNPLAAISGSIELLQTMPSVDEDNRMLMDIVTREIERLDNLIRDLLDYTNPRPRELLGFDAAELVRETVQVFEQDRSFERVSLRAVALEVAPVVADPGQIRQVLWNLLRNAAEAARSVVTATVRCDSQPALVVIEVDDDGDGIASENLERIFDPFFTTKSEGSGLGLATCHSIVREHGGDIRAENLPGGGTRFSVILPRSGDE
ncbi:two-component system sensor histidine kinase NtrB [Haliangium ochraceum]|uniref:histidine kinase n=1 Tax=Haliangium ochraceum (strain DSM 14365 / JCM 11303 / SMP-2) TaxID=502025 RepID=D0LSU3_HALO1|nr:ATP-binding protein [Haliangium ochraceum]ACY17315.1 multi-sensor signal transduction histidine kinase [Haliangium ochraceum DSM 14365]